jgi:hypothetical protein
MDRRQYRRGVQGIQYGGYRDHGKRSRQGALCSQTRGPKSDLPGKPEPDGLSSWKTSSGTSFLNRIGNRPLIRRLASQLRSSRRGIRVEIEISEPGSTIDEFPPHQLIVLLPPAAPKALDMASFYLLSD